MNKRPGRPAGETALDEFETIRLDVASHVATVTIMRPPVNAQNNKFRDELVDCKFPSTVMAETRNAGVLDCSIDLGA